MSILLSLSTLGDLLPSDEVLSGVAPVLPTETVIELPVFVSILFGEPVMLYWWFADGVSAVPSALGLNLAYEQRGVVIESNTSSGVDLPSYLHSQAQRSAPFVNKFSRGMSMCVSSIYVEPIS